MVAAIEKAMKEETPETAICIVSDHGFAATERQLNLRAAFLKAGLMTVNAKKTGVMGASFSDWRAVPWGTGGSSYVVLKDPKDAALRAQVEKLLQSLAADPTNGIAAVLDRKGIADLGGTALADFAVDMTPGFAIGNGRDAVTAKSGSKGQHGYAPTHPELLASFVLAGPGVTKGGNLGEIDMRSIAPTLAKLLGTSLPSAERPALSITK